MRLRLTVNGAPFTARLENNAAARALASRLPAAWTLQELNGNFSHQAVLSVKNLAVSTQRKGAGKDLISLPALSKQDLSLTLDLQVLKAVLADGVFHPTGISLSCFLIHAGLYEHFREKALLLISALGHLAAHIGQVEKVILVHCEKTAVF